MSPARPAGALMFIVALALVAGCGSSQATHVAQLGSSTAHRSATGVPSPSGGEATALAFSRCMRARGVPDFPDPNTSGQFPKVVLSQLAAGNARYPAARAACAHLLPHGGVPSSAGLQQAKTQALRFSQCVRRHGVTNFPDPGGDGRIPDPASVGIDQGSPQFQAANQACRAYRPPYMPSNAAYDAWARTSTS